MSVDSSSSAKGVVSDKREETKGHILVIGAHAGDAELMAGGVVAMYTQMGYKATLLHMTLGEKGHRSKSPREYAEQKREEALAAARILGAQVRFMPYRDAELPLNDEVKYQLCDIIRELKPDLIVTHWKGSMHKDHENTYYIVNDAIFYAALPSIERSLPAHGCWRLYFAENWEDPYDFEIDTYVDFSPAYDKWVQAISQYEFVSGNISSFPYLDFYKSLARVRGCLSRSQYAEAFMSPRGALVRKGSRFPGF